MEKLNYYLMCVAVFATIFLLVNANTANAVNLNIITGNKTENVKLDLNDYLKRKLTSADSGDIKVDIGGSDPSPIEQALLYLCKDKNPVECAKTLPIRYTTGVDTILKQKDLENNGKANLLSIIKTRHNWLADWVSIEGGSPQNLDPGDVDIYSSVNSTDIKEFIKNYGMIPLSFIDNVDFKGKKIYQATGIEKKKGRVENISIEKTRFVDKLEKDQGYIFAFPTDNQKVYSPVTFYNVPQVCGDNLCSIGENYQTCWADCKCPEGQTAGRTGCIKQSNVKLILDSMDPDTVQCLVPGLEYGSQNPNASCKPLPLQVKYHIENAPLNYSISPNSFYFEMNPEKDSKPQSYKALCTPQNVAQYGLTLNDLLTPPSYNVSDYECQLNLPDISGVRGALDTRSLILGMYMNVLTQNGTETIEVANSTSVDLNVLGADFSELASVQRMLSNAKKTVKTIQDVTSTLQWVSLILSIIMTIRFAFCVFGSLAGAAFTFGALAGAVAACVAELASWIITIAAIQLLISLAITALKLCQGQPLGVGEIVGISISVFSFLVSVAGAVSGAAATAVQAAGTAAKAGAGTAGAAQAVASIPTWYVVAANVDRFLSLANLVSLPAVPSYAGNFKGFSPLQYAGTATSSGASGKVAERMHSIGDACGKEKIAEQRARQVVGETENRGQIEVKKVVSSLIFVKGNITGRTGALCGDEGAKLQYSFDAFGCTDLWFSINGKERPACNLQTGQWMNPKDKVFGDKCNPQINTTDYSWTIQNQTGQELGVRNYNTTGIRTLLETKASSLFNPPADGSEFNVFVSCDGATQTGKIEDKFKLANYTAQCGQNIQTVVVPASGG